MLTKHGHRAIGRCRKCKSDIHKTDGKYCICPNCGKVEQKDVELYIYPSEVVK